MIVIGESGAMLKAGYLQRVQGYLASRGVATILYDRIKPNPESEAVDEGAAAARDKKVDFVVGLGGGSTIDSAKSIALMARNDGSYWDYMHGGSGGGKTPNAPALPIVALPTTAGTGTEANAVDRYDPDRAQGKKGWGNESTFPHLAIVDPELTHTLPSRITAYTGMGAFFNAVGAILATSRQPAQRYAGAGGHPDHQPISSLRGERRYGSKRPHMLSWASTAAGMSASLSSGISHARTGACLERLRTAFAPWCRVDTVIGSLFQLAGGRRPERFDLLGRCHGPDARRRNG